MNDDKNYYLDQVKEREYNFSRSKGHGVIEDYVVKESELTQSDKDLLLGHTIHEFNKLPEEVQNRFLSKLVDSFKEKMDLIKPVKII